MSSQFVPGSAHQVVRLVNTVSLQSFMRPNSYCSQNGMAISQVNYLESTHAVIVSIT